MTEKYFEYGEEELNFLKSKDKKLSDVIEKVGHVYRVVNSDLFSSVVFQIIGQQISSKAQDTIKKRFLEKYKILTPQVISNVSTEDLQSVGISSRKAEYIKNFAEKILNGEFNIDAVKNMSDNEAILYLSSLKGVGVWTAEMTLLFCLQRKNIFSFNDFAIKRGLKIIYRHREIDRKKFERYRKRFSPYCSVASLYLWEVAGGRMS